MPATPSPLALATAVDKATGEGVRRTLDALSAGNRGAAAGHLERVLAHRPALTDAFDLADEHGRVGEVRDHLAASGQALRRAGVAYTALLDGDLEAATAVLRDTGGDL